MRTYFQLHLHFVNRISRGLAGAFMGLLLATSSSSAATYTGSYDWLSQYHTTHTTSSTAYTTNIDGFTWAAAGPGSTDNSIDRWHQITWDQNVTLSRVTSQTWNQIGTIGTWSGSSG